MFCVQKGLFYSPGFLTLLLTAWINGRFVFADAARTILLAWGSRATDVIANLPGCAFAGENPSFAASLAAMVPHEALLASLILGIWFVVVKPSSVHMDIAMSQLDG